MDEPRQQQPDQNQADRSHAEVDIAAGRFSAAGLFMRGMAMGMGDAVPGVSGGTIALITGIYPQLLLSIRRFDLRLAQQLLQRRWAQAWLHIQGSFLLFLATGMLAGLLASASTVLLLLETQRQLVMGLFCGLVLASAIMLRDRLNWLDWRCWLALALGLALTTAVAELNPLGLAVTLPNLFFAGAIAISAMILPGLSGAFILLLLGLYEPMLEALLQLQWLQIGCFALGCGLGLMAFSRLLSWLLASYPTVTYAWVWGLLIGSLQILWPWRLIPDPELPEFSTAVLPWSAAVAEPRLLETALAVAAGLLLVYGLHIAARRDGDRSGAGA